LGQASGQALRDQLANEAGALLRHAAQRHLTEARQDRELIHASNDISNMRYRPAPTSRRPSQPDLPLVNANLLASLADAIVRV
jgi:hypothetical protein